jgi:hypothetical protein
MEQVEEFMIDTQESNEGRILNEIHEVHVAEHVVRENEPNIVLDEHFEDESLSKHSMSAAFVVGFLLLTFIVL